jgi:hypothetical protein
VSIGRKSRFSLEFRAEAVRLAWEFGNMFDSVRLETV